MSTGQVTYFAEDVAISHRLATLTRSGKLVIEDGHVLLLGPNGEKIESELASKVVLTAPRLGFGTGVNLTFGDKKYNVTPGLGQARAIYPGSPKFRRMRAAVKKFRAAFEAASA